MPRTWVTFLATSTTDSRWNRAPSADDYLVQAIYAARTTLAWRGEADLGVQVYTDTPNRFASIAERVELRVLDRATIRAWHGRWGFFFRMKSQVILDTWRRHPGDAVLLLDGDTAWRGPLAPALGRIGPGRSVMHLREDHVATHPSHGLSQFRRRMRPARFRGVPVELDAWMWNAGAVGLDAQDGPLVDDWVAFMDEVYPFQVKGAVEQYGISLLLQQPGRVLSPIDDLLEHYYVDKVRFSEAIRTRLPVLEALPPAEADRAVREAPILLEGPPPPHPRPRRWIKVRDQLREGTMRLGARLRVLR